MKEILLNGFYVLVGIIFFISAYKAFRSQAHEARIGTALFWAILGFLFVFGPLLPPVLIGGAIVFLGILTAIKKVKATPKPEASDQQRMQGAHKNGNRLFLPALMIGVIAFVFGQFVPRLGGLVGLGFGAVSAAILGLLITGSDRKHIPNDTTRLLHQIGPTAILPQLLGAIGALFATAGVGDVIASAIGSIIPQGNIFLGVIAYCLGMMIFTMIMGNAFAAFTVITAGIGLPFVISQGANPAIAGALALTAGYCGTLMTPMAANFNIIPAAILETQDKNAVIKSQIPFGIVLLVIHIALMYILAF